MYCHDHLAFVSCMLEVLSLKSKMPQSFFGFQQERGRDLTFSHKGTWHLDLELCLGLLFKVLSFDFKRSLVKVMKACLKE